MDNIEDKCILKNVERISISKYEIDIIASYILNRLEINASTNTKTEHENPGIASIWKDEICRRNEMHDILPPPEIPTQEDRPNAGPTESHIFYCEALKTKLNNANETTTDESQINATLSSTILPQPKKTFNLKQFLENSVYPAECSQYTKNLLNASYIQNHTFSNDAHLKKRIETNLENSMIDENIIMSLTQKTEFSADDTCKLVVKCVLF